MGGYGSGRQDGRAATHRVPSLDVRHLRRDAVLAPGTFSRWTWMVGGSGLSLPLRAQGDQVLTEHLGWMPGRVESLVGASLLLDRSPATSAGSRPCTRREFPAARSLPKSCPTAVIPITQRRMWGAGTR